MRVGEKVENWKRVKHWRSGSEYRALDKGVRGLGTGCEGGREGRELAECVRKGV